MSIQIEATATGASSASPVLPPGEFILAFFSAGAFGLDVQVGDGANFADLYYDAATKASISSGSGPRQVKVTGGAAYRMDVATYNNPITMTITRATGDGKAFGTQGKF